MPPIEYVKPTSRAMGRMTTILFRPFDLGKWFALGFSAWLASFLSSNSSSSGGGSGSGEGIGEGTGDESIEETLQPVFDYIRDNLDWILPTAIAVAVILTVLTLVLLWIGSRGKFMFLDNVVHNRSLISVPWSRYRKEGNSLFRWRLVFSAILLVVILGTAGGTGWYLYQRFDPEELDATWIATLVGAGLLVLMIVLAAVYITAMLEDFVIPIAYRHSLSTTDAWTLFLGIHSARPGTFIVYFLWRFLLQIAAGIAILAAIVVTCCLAGVIMIIPYLGAVLTLPVTVFFRALGPEFMRQFGGPFDLWEGSIDGGFSTGAPPLPSG